MIYFDSDLDGLLEYYGQQKGSKAIEVAHEGQGLLWILFPTWLVRHMGITGT